METGAEAIGNGVGAPPMTLIQLGRGSGIGVRISPAPSRHKLLLRHERNATSHDFGHREPTLCGGLKEKSFLVLWQHNLQSRIHFGTGWQMCIQGAILASKSTAQSIQQERST